MRKGTPFRERFHKNEQFDFRAHAIEDLENIKARRGGSRWSLMSKCHEFGSECRLIQEPLRKWMTAWLSSGRQTTSIMGRATSWGCASLFVVKGADGTEEALRRSVVGGRPDRQYRLKAFSSPERGRNMRRR